MANGALWVTVERAFLNWWVQKWLPRSTLQQGDTHRRRPTAVLKADHRRLLNGFPLASAMKTNLNTVHWVALFSLIGSSRFLLLFLLPSIWINVTSFWSPLFSLWLFIYLFQLHPREQRHAEWSLTAMSNISFCQIWPFSLSAVTWCLYVRLRVRHSERGEGALSEWPPQEGSTKSKKESKSKGRMNPRAGGKCKRGRGGHPCRVPGILAGSPHLGFRRLLSKRGKEGLFFTWTWENRCFVSRGGGVRWGEWTDAEKRNKAKDPSSQGMVLWGGGGAGGQPFGTGQMLKWGWFIGLGVLGGTWPPSQFEEWDTESPKVRDMRGTRWGGEGGAMRHLNTFYGHGALLALRPSWYFCPILL